MLTIRDIDWDRLWKEASKTSMRVRNKEFWNRRAPTFIQPVPEDGSDDYIGPFLRIMDAQHDWSVLDVGCGPGILAFPLAKIVRHVTAIDFSPAMIALLEEQKKAKGIRNVTAQLARWEDNWEALGIERHDVAIASRSLISDEPQTLLKKLISFARRRVYVSCPAGEGPVDRLLLEAIGREARACPDYIYIYNMLHQMEIYANVSLIEKKTRLFSGEEEAVDAVRWMLENMTPAEEEALRRFVSAHLVPEGKQWKLDYQRPVCWAVIWWNVVQRP